jgi:hypothetical protein
MLRLFFATIVAFTFVSSAYSDETITDHSVVLAFAQSKHLLPTPPMSPTIKAQGYVQCGPLRCTTGCCAFKLGDKGFCHYSCASMHAPVCPSIGQPC